MDEFWRETFRSVVTPLRALRFSLATLLLATCFVASCIAVWVNREPWEIAASIRPPEFSPKDEPLHPKTLPREGEILIERGHKDHRLTVWNWHSGSFTPVEFPAAEMLLETAPAAGRYFTADKSGTARVRQIGSANPLIELPHWIFPTASNPRISPDGNRIAASGPDGAVWLYDLNEQRETTFPARSKSTERVMLEFSGDGRWLQSYEYRTDPNKPHRSFEPEYLGWQLIDCKQGAVVQVPALVEKCVSGAVPQACSFEGSKDCVFINCAFYWKVGTDKLTEWPSVAKGTSPDIPPTYLAFDSPSGPFEVWTSDLSKCVGRVQVVVDPGLIPGIYGVSSSGRHLAVGGREATLLYDTTTGERLHAFPLPLRIHQFLKEDVILAFNEPTNEVQVWRRRRPESTWGLLALPEFWLMPVFLIATIFSIRRDRRKLWSGAGGPGPTS